MKTKVFFMAILLSAFLFANDKVINYDCRFSKYATEDGLHKAENFYLKFKVDIQTGKSYQEGNNGLSDVILVYNEIEKSVTFIEVTSWKNVMTTTIIANGKAVHSRHTAMLGKIVPSQYYGECIIK
ncbi:hypothetical protein [Nitrosophilus alvini]|uniref:hypothetical protein n=1 Tax=Nitrosophilus alvini TaxID=2714855 RepID=UPI00190A8053|nr:hypothetical protein [Nitrosophilus alvini]